jgi:hypothetical protein
LYTCEYLRECRQYTQSWKKLKEGVKYWGEIPSSTKKCFKKVKAEIYKFVMEKCVLEGEELFHKDAPLAYEPKHERLRKWPTLMRPTAYKWAIDFD